MKFVLITGAGATHRLSAIPDEPLPLMKDWAARLRERLGGPLAELTTLTQASTGPEFEEILGALFRWESSLDDMLRFSEMTRPDPAQPDGVPDYVRQGVEHAKANVAVVMARLHASLFDEFGPERLDPDACGSAYRALFARLGNPKGEPPEELICATTNYDRSLELTFEQLGVRPRTGFTTHAYLSAALDPMGLGDFQIGSPSVVYLHGAVGWYVNPRGFITSLPADQGYNETLGRPAVLYPDPQKEVERAETAALWEEFRRGLRDATHVLVVGHSLIPTS
jgi:hypothetical protein